MQDEIPNKQIYCCFYYVLYIWHRGTVIVWLCKECPEWSCGWLYLKRSICRPSLINWWGLCSWSFIRHSAYYEFSTSFKAYTECLVMKHGRITISQCCEMGSCVSMTYKQMLSQVLRNVERDMIPGTWFLLSQSLAWLLTPLLLPWASRLSITHTLSLRSIPQYRHIAESLVNFQQVA